MTERLKWHWQEDYRVNEENCRKYINREWGWWKDRERHTNADSHNMSYEDKQRMWECQDIFSIQSDSCNLFIEQKRLFLLLLLHHSSSIISIHQLKKEKPTKWGRSVTNESTKGTRTWNNLWRKFLLNGTFRLKIFLCVHFFLLQSLVPFFPCISGC